MIWKGSCLQAETSLPRRAAAKAVGEQRGMRIAVRMIRAEQCEQMQRRRAAPI
jgi:hypothetical protein